MKPVPVESSTGSDYAEEDSEANMARLRSNRFDGELLDFH
jgi:hypothetical protein